VTGIFDDQHAGAYDTVYAAKNYGAECDAVERLIARYGDGAMKTLLDMGCGTGRHAAIFADHGFEVTGIDQSESMLALARERAQQAGLASNPTFLYGDIRTFSAPHRFDATLMNFNVLGYMTSNDDVLGALGTARRNVRTAGLFVADFWYGPAVVAEPPGKNTREFAEGGDRIIRSSSGRDLPDLQCCEISVNLLRQRDGATIVDTTEVHRVRYFFPLELELLLRTSGFKLLGICGFPDIDAPAKKQNWSACLVAKAI
jgi:SAM-dependent methyltransferase